MQLPKAAYSTTSSARGGLPEDLSLRPAPLREGGEAVVYFNKRDGLHLRSPKGGAGPAPPSESPPMSSRRSPSPVGRPSGASLIPADNTGPPRMLSQTIQSSSRVPVRMPQPKPGLHLPVWAQKALMGADAVDGASPGSSAAAVTASRMGRRSEGPHYAPGLPASPLVSAAESFVGDDGSGRRGGPARSPGDSVGAASVTSPGLPGAGGATGRSVAASGATFGSSGGAGSGHSSNAVLSGLRPSPLLSPLSYAARGSPASDPDVVLMAASEGVVYYQAFAGEILRAA